MEHESSAIESSAKRQQLSCKRVCVVCHFFSPATDEFVFFIVDCNSSSCDEYPYMEPKIRYKADRSSSSATFCAIKSTLYMFEGDDHHSPGSFAGKFVIPKELYDTPNLKKEDTRILKKGDLFEIKGMHEKKCWVEALPTPDGESILVFSSKIICGYDGSFGDSFELYNVGKDSWERLPHLPPKRPSSHYPAITITAFGFQTESHFLIQMEDEIHVLDLKASPRAWIQSSVCTLPKDGYFLSSGGFYFFPRYASDGVDGGRMHYLPLSSFPDEDAYLALPSYERYCGTVFPSITSLCCEDGGYDFVVAHAQCVVDPDGTMISNNLRMILDIHRADIENYKGAIETIKSDLDEDPKPANLIKTIKFLTDFDFRAYDFGRMFSFSV